MTNTQSRGFTLTEILIVIVIVGILSTLAIPSYRNYVMRTNRTVAKVALQELVTKQESYAVDHKVYAADFARLGIAGSGAASVAYVGSDGAISRNAAGALYQLALSNTTGTVSSCSSTGTATDYAFTLTATRLSDATDTVCGNLCISSGGVRGASLGTATDCWKR